MFTKPPFFSCGVAITNEITRISLDLSESDFFLFHEVLTEILEVFHPRYPGRSSGSKTPGPMEANN